VEHRKRCRFVNDPVEAGGDAEEDERETLGSEQAGEAEPPAGARSKPMLPFRGSSTGANIWLADTSVAD